MDKNLFSYGKAFWLFLSFLFIFTFFPKREVVLAEEKVSEASATVFPQKEVEDEREEKLRKFLKTYNSPLAAYSHFLVKTADQYYLDWKLLPAICGVETGFGNRAPFNSFNAYGWNNGKYYFKDWPDGIEIVSKALKENYIDRGVKTVEQIGPIYATSPLWAQGVAYFMRKIENFNSPSTLQFSL